MQLENPSLYQNSSFINGQWQSFEQVFSVENPANGDIIGEVGEITPEQLNHAIEAADTALEQWKQLNVNQRSQLLMRWYELIMANQADLGKILTLEQGKPYTEATGEVVYGAKYVEWYAEEAKRLGGEVLPVNKDGRRSIVIRRPVGVVAAITPWNFPSAMILRKAAPALAAGCTLVIKPSELTPFSALALAKLAEEAGFPPGVINVVCSSDPKPIGAAFTTHPKVSKIGFTGSTAVGKQLLKACADDVKKASLELGGNAPLIVFDDADLDLAVKGTMASKFRNAGQTCVCANRLFVHQSVVKSFIDKLLTAIADLKVGDGMDQTVNVGPLINRRAIDKVSALLDNAISNGASLISGGETAFEKGNFFQPTVITDVDPEMDIFNTEIFGPVASIIPFQSDDEVVNLANKTPYGLCSYIFTQSASRQWLIPERLDYGMVGVNEGLLSNPVAPFGGVKESGMGREGGAYGMQDYLETKYVCVGGIG